MSGRANARIPSSSSRVVSCGVSMPTSRAGSLTSSNAAGESLAEAVTALRDDLEPLPRPVLRVALEHEHPAPRRRPPHDLEGVRQSCVSDRRGLSRSARWRKPGLGPARKRLLGDHHQRDAIHASKPSRSRARLKYETRKPRPSCELALKAPPTGLRGSFVCQARSCARTAHGSGQAPAGSVPSGLLAQPVARSMAHISPRTRAPDRDFHRRGHRLPVE